MCWFSSTKEYHPISQRFDDKRDLLSSSSLKINYFQDPFQKKPSKWSTFFVAKATFQLSVRFALFAQKVIILPSGASAKMDTAWSLEQYCRRNSLSAVLARFTSIDLKLQGKELSSLPLPSSPEMLSVILLAGLFWGSGGEFALELVQTKINAVWCFLSCTTKNPIQSEKYDNFDSFFHNCVLGKSKNTIGKKIHTLVKENTP